MVLTDFDAPLSWESLADPTCRPDEAIVQVMGCGVCATDLKIASGVVPGVSLPHVPGHEIAGVVVETGRDVKRVQVGDHVCSHYYIPCLECVYCRQGRTNLCLHLAGGERAGRIGFTRPGGYAQYVSVPARLLAAVPSAADLSALCVTADAIATAYHALYTRAGIHAGQRLLLLGGAGGVGAHALQLARSEGMDVTVVDRAERRAVAEDFGANAFVDGADEEAWQALREQGRFVHVVLDCAGDRRLATRSYELLRPGGRYVVVGYQYGENVDLPYQPTVSLELETVGSRASTMGDFVAALDRVLAGDVQPFVTQRFALAAANEALDAVRAARRPGRCVLTPNEEEREK